MADYNAPFAKPPAPARCAPVTIWRVFAWKEERRLSQTLDMT
jgi:hypothetical protein